LNTMATATQETFLLLVTLADETILWKPETRESMDWAELDPDGTYYLNADTRLPQIVTPETMSITQEQIRDWWDAADRFIRYTDAHPGRMSDEEEVRASTYEREMNEKEGAITAAIREVQAALLAAAEARRDATDDE
jgi:hypothetical protein